MRSRSSSRPRCARTPRSAAWGIEDSAARLRIQTIDAFNGYLANSLPITSQNGFGRTIADAPDDLYAAAARETLRHAESDPELRKDFELILRRLDDNWHRLELLIAGMLPKRAEWLPNLPQLSGEALVPKIEASLSGHRERRTRDGGGGRSRRGSSNRRARWRGLPRSTSMPPNYPMWRSGVMQPAP